MPFQPGICPNPKGRPVGASGFQSWPTICNKVSEEFGPDELIDLASRIRAGKKVPLSTIKALAVQNVAAALQGEGKERERLLDRLLGKAVQRIGGENPGEGIKISAGFDTTNLDTDSLLELAEAVERVKSRVIDAQFVEVPAQAQLEQPESAEEQGE